jgi:hypothetical protein
LPQAAKTTSTPAAMTVTPIRTMTVERRNSDMATPFLYRGAASVMRAAASVFKMQHTPAR